MKSYIYTQHRYKCEFCGADSADEEEILACEKSHCKDVVEFHICLPTGEIYWTSKGRNEKGSYPKFIDVLYTNGMTVRYRAEDELNLQDQPRPKYEARWRIK